EVYATSGALERSRTLFACTTLEAFHVKGKSEPVQAYAVGDEAGARASDSRAFLPFRGRDAEIARIRSALSEVVDGRECRVAVVGETGMGKTRLVDEALRGTDVAVFRVQGEANGA